ncbi:hypothetical protein EFT48_10310, partial [Limosilactobacillus fermentum]|nr:hypothetical protein [Limosilactobacillus fermentum]
VLRHYLILQFTSLIILNQSLYLTCTLFILGPKFALVCLIAVGWPFIWLIWKFIKFNLECIAYTLRQIFK